MKPVIFHAIRIVFFAIAHISTGALLAYKLASSKMDCACLNSTGLSLVNSMYLHGCLFLEDGAQLAASKTESNLDLSTGLVENALTLHLFAMSSLMGCPVFAIFVIISSVIESPIWVVHSRSNCLLRPSVPVENKVYV
jgi:hypothetical protein